MPGPASSLSAYSESVTRIAVPGTHNFRTVEGTCPGSLYRSDALARLPREGRRMLRSLGIRRVIDLRTGFDRRIGGPDRLRGTGAELVRVPILSGGIERHPSALRLDAIYRSLLDEHGAAVGEAVRAIADAPDGGVLVHCTAGKDRSGLVCALVQLAIGVPRETVLDDYAQSESHLAGAWADRMLGRIRRFRVRPSDELVLVLTGSPRALMAEMLDRLDDAHGGVEAYLATAGVGPDVLTALRARLLEP